MRAARFAQAKRHNMKGYSSHYVPGKKYRKAKIEFMGSSATLFGCVDDDYNSCDVIQNAIEGKMPDALILGDLSKWNLDFYRLGFGKYMQRPSLRPMAPEDALARKKLNKFFQE